MTLKQCIKKNGWCVEVEELKRFQSVVIAFLNGEGESDETEFDISGACTDAGAEELSALYEVFCKECGIKSNRVTAVRVVHSADTYEGLP
jgi:hypothetical protein